MRILVISKEAWRDEQNGGNVLSNIFSGFDADFAQIYCTDNMPNNGICKKYYQITDRMMVNSITKRKQAGAERCYEDYPVAEKSQVEGYTGIKRYNLEIVRVLRELVWKIGKWNTEAIKEFARGFQPDIIFAPCYGNHYMIRMTKLVHEACKVPVISYISDDFYTNKQLSFSPFYWANHFILRKNVRSVFKLYSLVYTMTDEQKEQCERDFHANMKILRKSGSFDKQFSKIAVNNPIRFVYGGGIYLNRWKTLSKLADAMRKVNQNGVRMVLDIYTGNEIGEKAKRSLNDGTTTFLHDTVSSDQLKAVYHSADVALHVEGFDIGSRYSVRMSFSTKIVDCLDSGCAVMAICDDQQAGFAYLKRNDAAICVSSIRDIDRVLNSIAANPEMLIEYQHRAYALGEKNHSKESTKKAIETDFKRIAYEGSAD